ncbi:MAG: hypothetical protein WDN10_01800 [bacterium]
MKTNKTMSDLKRLGGEEFERLESEYKEWRAGPRILSNPVLITLSILGIALILCFQTAFPSFIGILIFAYALYTFATREGHREGYFEGYYEAKGRKMPGEGEASAEHRHSHHTPS